MNAKCSSILKLWLSSWCNIYCCHLLTFPGCFVLSVPHSDVAPINNHRPEVLFVQQLWWTQQLARVQRGVKGGQWGWRRGGRWTVGGAREFLLLHLCFGSQFDQFTKDIIDECVSAQFSQHHQNQLLGVAEFQSEIHLGAVFNDWVDRSRSFWGFLASGVLVEGQVQPDLLKIGEGFCWVYVRLMGFRTRSIVEPFIITVGHRALLWQVTAAAAAAAAAWVGAKTTTTTLNAVAADTTGSTPALQDVRRTRPGA